MFFPEERAVKILAFDTFMVSRVGEGFFWRFLEEARLPPSRFEFVLVMRPENSSLYTYEESLRC